MAMAAGGLAIGPRLAVCREGAMPATDIAAPLTIDPGVPWWLQNNFEPMFAEVAAFDLPVAGPLPAELTGLYLQRGGTGRRVPGPGALRAPAPPSLARKALALSGRGRESAGRRLTDISSRYIFKIG